MYTDLQNAAARGARWLAACALALLIGAASVPVLAQDNVFADGEEITGDVTLSGEVTLNGLVFVGEATDTGVPTERNTTLTIEPGTVIKGRPGGGGTTPGALIVRRSAEIIAEGTPARPIIMTSTEDDLSDPFDMFDSFTNNPDRGRWGGLIILGRATTNQPTTDNQIEGIPSAQPALYGGDDDLDDSGTLRFVSLRHGGFSISGVSGDEINGLTMGALGRGTTIEFFEVFANDDDGFEWFGGTVHTKYLVAAYNADDSFDYDQGFRGSGQFWYSLSGADDSGRAGEHDGGDAAGDDAEPKARPLISNVTYLGAGVGNGGSGQDTGVIMRDAAGGEYYNSIFHDVPGTAVKVEDIDGTDSRQRYEDGDLVFENNVFGSFGDGSTFADLAVYVDSDGNPTGAIGGFGDVNTLQNPGVTIDRTADGEGGTDPRPTADLPSAIASSQFAANAAADVDGVSTSAYLSKFDDASYVGAFSSNDGSWLAQWSYLDELDEADRTDNTQTFADGEEITGDVTLSGEVTLNGLVFVGEATDTGVPTERNTTLTIEPGTVIKGRPGGGGTTPGALIVRRSAEIIAEGTPARPIIMTSTEDDLSDPFDMFDSFTNNPDRGRWGGLIILGRATTNQPTTDNQIEGIPSAQPALYGGDDDLDDSGTLRFVSLRHGGFSISGVSGDEINGLTMGALGRGTTIEFFEVFANDDDGFEWFGGTVHTKYLVAAYNADDSFDYDQGFRGSGQFWYSLSGADDSGRAGEHDGGDAAGDDAEPKARPLISNVTYLGAGVGNGGSGQDTGVIMRDAAGGEYYNSIFHDVPGTAVKVEDIDGTDSRQRYEDGDLVFENNVFGSFGDGSTFADLAVYVDSDGNPTGAIGGFGDVNTLQNPGVTIDRTADGEGGTDPRPTADLPSAIASSQFAANAAADVDGVTAEEYVSVFEDVDFVGAFRGSSTAPALNAVPSSNDFWIAQFTYLGSELGEVLPVELAAFEVSRDGNGFVLSWQTASETNNAGFDIQRSVDGSAFTTIGFRQGAGTTEQAQSYRFVDSDLPFEASDVKYRLRQVDLDGTESFSDVRTVSIAAPQTLDLQGAFPNPATTQATVRYRLPKDGSVQLSVYNVLGQRVMTLVDGEQSAGSKEYTIDTGALSSGVYFVRLRADGRSLTERITVVK